MVYVFYNPLLDILLGVWAVVLAFGVYKHIVNIKSGKVKYEDRRLMLYFFVMYAVSFFVIYFFNYVQSPVEYFDYLFYLGIFIAVLGILFGAWAIYNYGEQWSFSIAVFKGQKVEDKGPNAIVRHPFYLSNFLFLFGYSIALGTLLSILGAFLALGFMIYMADVEEKKYIEELGEAYREYMKKVRYRIIPFIY